MSRSTTGTTRSGNTLLQSSAMVAVGTGLSRLTGMLRVIALAYALGQAGLADAYNLANTTPNVIYELIVGGILTATLVPTFVDAFQKDDEESVHAVVTVAIVALVVITVVAIVAAPAIISLFTVLKDEGRAEQQAVAVPLLRLFFPQILFYGLTAIGTALLNARNSFSVPAFAPVLNNLAVCLVLVSIPTLFLDGGDTEPTLGVAADDQGFLLWLGLGTTAGIVAMTVALLPALRRAGSTFRWHFDLNHPAVRGLARLTGWTMGFVLANQIAWFAVRALALSGAEGDLSAYDNAYIFFQLPHGLFAVSLITTFLPGLAAFAAAKDFEGFRARFSQGLRLTVLVVLPAAIGYVLIARPLIALLLQRGEFDATDALLTSEVLQWMAVGLPGYSLYIYVIRGFYALRDTRTTFLLAVIQNGTNVITAIPLTDAWGVQGLAASFSISYAAGAIAGLWLLRRRVERLDGRRNLNQILRIVAAAAVMGLAVYVATTTIGGVSGSGAVIRTLSGVAVGAVVYLAALVVFRVDDLDNLRARLPGAQRD